MSDGFWIVYLCMNSFSGWLTEETIRPIKYQQDVKGCMWIQGFLRLGKSDHGNVF